MRFKLDSFGKQRLRRFELRLARLKKKSKTTKLAYLSYPYSDGPKKRTDEVVKLARKIMAKHPEIFVIVPHTAVDYTLFGEIPEKITDHKVDDHLVAPIMEFIILSKVDMFIIGCPLDVTVSKGMIWEWAFCKWRQLNGENVEIVKVEELIE